MKLAHDLVALVMLINKLKPALDQVWTEHLLLQESNLRPFIKPLKLFAL
jgi:hypothetical protein